MTEYEIIVDTMKAAGCPLTDDQATVMAGALGVVVGKAVLEEREACAKLCEDDCGNGALNLAEAIRARGQE